MWARYNLTYKRHVSPELQSVSEKHIRGKPMLSNLTKLALKKQQRDIKIKFRVMSVDLRNWIWLWFITIINHHYGITGYRVSRPEIQNQKDFCIKINVPKGNYWILRIGLMGSLSSLQKSELLKLIILIFHVKKFKNKCELDIMLIACNF